MLSGFSHFQSSVELAALGDDGVIVTAKPLEGFAAGEGVMLFIEAPALYCVAKQAACKLVQLALLHVSNDDSGGDGDSEHVVSFMDRGLDQINDDSAVIVN